MAVLSAARFLIITDALAAAMLSAKGTGSNGLGVNATEEPSDDIGARGRLGDLAATVMAYAEDDYLAFLSGLRASEDKAGFESWCERVLTDAVDKLEDLCVDAALTGVTSLTGFAAYHNTGPGGPYAALVAPDFGRGVYYYVNGQYMDAKNVFSPVVANMGSRAFGGAFADGTAIDATKYAGAKVLNVTVPGLTGVGGVVLVTGNGRTSAGATVTGRTWSAEVTTTAATPLDPANAGDICTDVTNIELPDGITAGTATVSCAAPRTNPPV